MRVWGDEGAPGPRGSGWGGVGWVGEAARVCGAGQTACCSARLALLANSSSKCARRLVLTHALRLCVCGARAHAGWARRICDRVAGQFRHCGQRRPSSGRRGPRERQQQQQWQSGAAVAAAAAAVLPGPGGDPPGAAAGQLCAAATGCCARDRQGGGRGWARPTERRGAQPCCAC